MNIYSSDYVGSTGLHPIYEYVDDTSNVISERINNLTLSGGNYAEIIGITDANYTEKWGKLTSEYGNNLITISSNIGFINVDKTNRCIVRFGDIKNSIAGLTTNDKLATILGVNYMGIENVDTLVTQLLEICGWINYVIDDDTRFVIVNNTYPFPYDWLDEISKSVLLNNQNINIHDSRINSSNIATNVEELIKIVAEHEIRLSTGDFRSTLTPIDNAKILAKWAYNLAKITSGIAPLTASIYTKLLVHLDIPTTRYHLLENYKEDLMNATIDSLDTIITAQNATNEGVVTAFGAIEEEILFIQKALGLVGGGTIGNSLFNLGTFTKDLINFLNHSNEAIGYSSNASNYTLDSSNEIIGYIKNTSNLLGLHINSTSNLLGLHINSTSNLLGLYINDTSNVISDRITNLPWKDNSTYLQYKDVKIYADEIKIDNIFTGPSTTLTKYPKVALTDETLCKQSSTYGINYSYKLFDFITTQTIQQSQIADGFYTPTTGIATVRYFPNYNGDWIMINLQEQIVLNKVIFYCSTYGFHTAPGIFRIYATNDISSFNTPSYTGWTIIHDQTTQLTGYVDGEPKEVNMINNTAGFSIYALVVYQLSGLNSPRLSFAEWELYGYPLITTGSVKTLIDDVVLNASNLNTSNLIDKNDTTINKKVDGLWLNDGLNVYNLHSNIGIGTSSPTYKLEVIGNTKFQGYMTLQNTNPISQTVLTIANDDRQKNVNLIVGNTQNLGIGSGNFGIFMNNDYRMTILSDNGNVGIGTANPTYKLEIIGGDMKLQNTDLERLETVFTITNEEGSNVHFLIAKKYHPHIAKGDFAIVMNDGYRMTIEYETGNVGIGKTNPTVLLDVNGETKINGKLKVENKITSYGLNVISQETNIFNFNNFVETYKNNKVLYYYPFINGIAEIVNNTINAVYIPDNTPQIFYDETDDKYYNINTNNTRIKYRDSADFPNAFYSFTIGMSIKFITVQGQKKLIEVYKKFYPNSLLTLLVEYSEGHFIFTLWTSNNYSEIVGKSYQDIDPSKEHFFRISFRTYSPDYANHKGDINIWVDNAECIWLPIPGTIPMPPEDQLNEIWIGGGTGAGGVNANYYYSDIIIMTGIYVPATNLNQMQVFRDIDDAYLYRKRQTTSFLYGKTYIEELILNKDKIWFGGRQYYPNDIDNFTTLQPALPATQQFILEPQDVSTSLRYNLKVGSNILNATSNILNVSGNAGFLYFEDGDRDTIPQVKNVSYNDLTNKPDIYLISGNIANASNLHTSNYVLSTSNAISTRIFNTSNDISTRILNTSNDISTRILNTSNDISTRLNNVVSSPWNNNTTNLQYGDVRVYNNKITIGNDIITYGITARAYPPVALASTSDTDNTTTKTLTEQDCSYGNGVYNISWSSDLGSGIARPSHLFNGRYPAASGGIFANNTYLATSGEFNTNYNKYIVSTYLGEWVKLQLPTAIYLSYIKIYQRNGYEVRSPKNYKVYGSTDGTNWTELLSETGASYVSGVHTSQTTNIQTISPYNYYALCVNALIAGSTLLNFDELQFYGNETRDIVNIILAPPVIIEPVLNASNINTSNYVLSTSNDISTRILNTSNDISTRITGLHNVSLATIGNIANASNLHTSNYVLSTSNDISTRITGLHNVSLATIGNIANASNLHTSNYVLSTSNAISTRINNLSLGSSLWTNNTTNLQYGDVKVYSDKITLTSGSVSNPPTIVGSTATLISGNTYYCAFTATSGTQTITFPTDTVCDILVVGGGGSGGSCIGGGGGAGGVVYTVNQTMTAGTYDIFVGAGGVSGTNGTVGVANDGVESSIKQGGSYVSKMMGGTSIALRGFQGGKGGIYNNSSTNAVNNGNSGGSGGGASDLNSDAAFSGGSSIQPNSYWNGTAYVAGGSSGNNNPAGNGQFFATGGGAIGTSTTIFDGKAGVSIDITGTPTYYAGGGGGGAINTSDTSKGLGGSGIGGNGGVRDSSGNFPRNVSNGVNGTGSGGGGGSYFTGAVSGAGGSGIVIIKWTQTAVPTETNLITNNVLNASNLNTSNYVLNTSNVISTRINSLGLNNVSLATIGDIATSSNLNTSNYVLSTSNNLQTQINGRALTSHTHTTANITGLDTALANKAPSTHSHIIGNITGLQEALDTKQATLTAGANINMIGGVISATSLWNTSGYDIFYNAGRAAIGSASFNGTLNLGGASATSRLVLSGEEFYQAGNTSTDGIAFICGVNRTVNRQLWIGDTASLTKNTTNNVIRITPANTTGASIDSIATDGATRLPMSLGGSINILASGNVGIGTTTPAQKLTIFGNYQIANFNTSSTGLSSYMGFRNTADAKTCYIGVDGAGLCDFERGAFVMGTWTDNSIIFTTGSANSEKMRITSSGNVGIGKTNPAYVLDVNGNVNCTGNYLVNGLPQYKTYTTASVSINANETINFTNSNYFNNFTTSGFFSLSVICNEDSTIYSCGHLYLSASKTVLTYSKMFEANMTLNYVGYILGISITNNMSSTRTFKMIFKDLTYSTQI